MLENAKARRHSSTLLAFWASVVCQALNSMIEQAQSGRPEIQQRREEDLLLQVLPIINDALAIRDVPELALGCYLICTILATKGNLDDGVLGRMMEAISGRLRAGCSYSGLVALAVIAQKRQSTKLPKTVVKHLVNYKDLPDQFASISRQYRIDKLATGMVLGMLKQSELSNQLKGVNLGSRLLLGGAFENKQSSKIIEAFIEVAHPQNVVALENAGLSGALSHTFRRLFDAPELEKVAHKKFQKLQIDIEELEMRLGTSIRSKHEAPALAPDEVSVYYAPSEDKTEQNLDHMINCLPKQLPDSISFLSSEIPGLFEQLCEIFTRALVSEKSLDHFKELNIWKCDGNTAFSSFCIRLWCGPFPPLTKTKALQLVTNEIRKKHFGDEQILMPYLLHALSDESARVRRAALELGLAINKQCTEDQKIKKEGSRHVVHKQAAKHIEWMSTSEFRKVVSAITPKLEECAMDASQISNVIERVLSKSKNDENSGQSKDDVHLKSKVRAAFSDYLCSHVGATDLYAVKLRLLKMLGRVGKSISGSRIQHLQPEVRKWASIPCAEASSICDRERLRLSVLDSAYLGVLSARDDGAIDFLWSVARGNIGDGRVVLQHAAFDRVKALWPALPMANRLSMSHTLLDWSLDVSLDAQVQERQAEAVDTLRAVALSTEILISFLDSIRSPVHVGEKPPTAKRRRTSKSGRTKHDIIDKDELDRSLRRMTFVLDLVEASTFRDQPGLLRSLFHLLGELQQCKGQADSDLTYLQTVTITIIIEIVDGGKGRLDPEMGQFVRVDLLIDCIRTTSNPQVHNSALLLISSLARWVPDRVLHSVMPIFTFMGSTLLRQSDEYSAHVVNTTITRVVPVLLKSLQEKSQDIIASTTELLSSFVAAYEHIPSHRRLQLFRSLSQTIGPEQSLFAVISMLVDRYPDHSSVEAFISELMGSFGAVEQIAACNRCLELVLDVLKPPGTLSQLVLGSKEKSEDQLAVSTTRILQNLTIVLGSTQLRAKFANSKRTDETTAEAIQDQYHTLLSKSMELGQVDKAIGALQTSSEAIEAAILSLPPVVDFIESAKRLLQDRQDDIRRRVLLSLESRLNTTESQGFQVQSAILEFLPRLIELMGEASAVPLKATTISCIGSIVNRYGKKNLDLAFATAQAISSKEILGNDNYNIRILCFLNLAGMVEVLQDGFIPLIPQILSKGFEYLETTLSTDDPNKQLHSAVFTMATAVIEWLPFILSGKSLDTALTLSFRSAGFANGDELSESRQEFVGLLPKKLGAKEIFSALHRTWPCAIRAGSQAVHESLTILHSAITENQNSQIVKNASALFALFLELFDLRRMTGTGAVEEYLEDITPLEELVHESALAMAFKMNDTIFRPFFIRVVEWASELQETKEARVQTLRSITLFSFCERLFDSLKAIVTRYSSYMLQHAAQVLEQYSRENHDKNDRSTLLDCTLRALQKSFEHDESGFWQSPAHFDPICRPLVSLLTQSSFSSDDNSERDPLAANGVLIPTIVAFAAASSSLEHHKALNSHLLAQLRSPNAAVRLAAVKTEQALWERLGEEWLAVLAEIIPYISELQEDDDEMVEREVHRWMQQIESVLGESLDGMLQ